MAIRETDVASREPISHRLLQKADSLAELAEAVEVVAREKLVNIIVPDQPRIEKSPTPVSDHLEAHEAYPPLFDAIRDHITRAQKSLLTIRDLLHRSEI